MAGLEDKIRALMEAKGEETLDEQSIEDLEEAKLKMNKDGSAEVDSDDEKESDDQEDDSEEESDDGETDVSKDAGAVKKNGADVQEETSAPGQTKSVVAGSDESKDSKQSKLKVGLGKKEAAGAKLTDTASADAKDDNGDNSRLEAGLSKKETNGKVTDGVNTQTTDAANAKNNVQTNEAMTALFAGEELSEEFQSKAKVIFEAAVEQAAAERIESLEEEYAQKIVELHEQQQLQIEEAVAEVTEGLVEEVDGFLNYVVEQWVDENQVAVESGMKAELVNSFIDGMKKVFKEHYVEIPDDKLNIVEEQDSQIEELAKELLAVSEANDALAQELDALKSELVFESVSSDLTAVQKEKFATLVENVEFTTEEEFVAKLDTLKKSYFSAGKEIAESVQLSEGTTEVTPETEETMSKYISALGKPIRF